MIMLMQCLNHIRATRVDCFELFGQCHRSFSFNFCYIVNVTCITLIVGAVYPLIAERCPVN